MEADFSSETPWGNAVETTVQQLESENHWEYLLEDGVMEDILTTKQTIDSVPPTRQLVDHRDFDSFSSNQFDRRIIVILGGWTAPEWLQRGKRTKYINPNYPHRGRLAQCAVTCPCGAVMNESNEFRVPDERTEHDDDCRVEWRKLADAKMWRMRRMSMLESMLYYKSEKYQQQRIGVNKSSTGHTAKQLGYSREELKKMSRKRAVPVIEELYDRGYTRNDMSVAFSVAGSTVSRWHNYE